MTAQFDENSSSSECQLSSIIQGTSEGIKKRRCKTSKSRRSGRMGGGEDIK